MTDRPDLVQSKIITIIELVSFNRFLLNQNHTKTPVPRNSNTITGNPIRARTVIECVSGVYDADGTCAGVYVS